MRRVEERTVFVLTNKDRVALRRRAEDGLLGGQWEFQTFWKRNGTGRAANCGPVGRPPCGIAKKGDQKACIYAWSGIWCATTFADEAERSSFLALLGTAGTGNCPSDCVFDFKEEIK